LRSARSWRRWVAGGVAFVDRCAVLRSGRDAAEPVALDGWPALVGGAEGAEPEDVEPEEVEPEEVEPEEVLAEGACTEGVDACGVVACGVVTLGVTGVCGTVTDGVVTDGTVTGGTGGVCSVTVGVVAPGSGGC
jgi:hypothetical protein